MNRITTILDSSTIASVSYDPDSQVLRIAFIDRNKPSALVSYEYGQVKAELYGKIVSAESVGSFIQSIKHQLKPIRKF